MHRRRARPLRILKYCRNSYACGQVPVFLRTHGSHTALRSVAGCNTRGDAAFPTRQPECAGHAGVVAGSSGRMKAEIVFVITIKIHRLTLAVIPVVLVLVLVC